MKRLLASFFILSILLSACSTVQPNNTDGDNSTESYSTESQHGTTDSTHTEQPTNTQSGGETVNTETTQGTESTTGATDPNTGETQGEESTQPTQGNTPPTEGNTTTPTEGGKPNVTEPPVTEETNPPATDPIPPTNPTTPTDPTNPTNPTNPITPVVVNLTVSPTSLNLAVGNTSTLTASYNGTGTLSWSSSNTSVVTVSNGKVTARAAGNAVVTVSDGSKSATCSITVTAPATTKTFTFNTTNNTTITAGSTFQIDYSYSGNNSELTWSSTDSSVLTVNNSGVVTAKAKGAATVKVTNGEKTWRLSINVEDAKPLVTSFYYEDQNAPLYDGVTKYAGDYMTFYVSTRPYESNRNINITSSNNNVVSVSYKMVTDGKIAAVTLNFNGAGTATVKIASADGAYSESYTITVKSDYDCNPGDGLLTPEQFAYCVNKVVEAHGFTISSNASSYKYLYLTDAELTWAYARREGENSARHWWSIGSRYVNVTYVGIAENGKHLFYTYH